MNMLVRTYEGKDLVIPRELIEELGVKPGEAVVIRPTLVLEPRTFAPGEWEELEQVLAEAAGSWTEEDEAAFRKNRELWATWQPRNLS
ncbi:MAG: AbrB/MazE/SpoVT family DNA-binding domain-containing protein [Anaerolineales bacterium]